MNRWPIVSVKRGAVARILIAVLALWLAGLQAGAQPPNVVHYQGVLLTNANVPVTTPQTVYFSIYRGGDATTFPSAGTLIYREHATITPNDRGLFEHAIGSGTVDSGTFDAELFKTDQPLFLEVAVDNPQNATNVLLPRSRFTSVGYAFVADNAVGNITPQSVAIQGVGTVIDSQGNWTGNPILSGPAGQPTITSIVDTTGGRLVIGDVIEINGSNLANARVWIGEREARIIGTPGNGQLRCQIPAGTPMGINPVRVFNTNNSNAMAAVAHIDVTRLLVAVRTTGGTGRVDVIDAGRRELVTSFNLSGTVRQTDQGGQLIPLQSAYGFDGSLLLIPSGFSNVYAIDMTANPPRQVDVFNTGSSNRAVSISPDGLLAAVADFEGSGGSQVRFVRIGQTFPPYNDTVLGSSSQLQSNELPNSFGASAVHFVSDTHIVVMGRTNGQLISLYRVPGTTGTNTRDIERLTTNDIPSGMTDTLALPPNPVRLQMTPDRTRFLLTSRGQLNLLSFYVATYWPGAMNLTNEGASAQGLPMKMAVSPDGSEVFVASRVDNDAQGSDRLFYYSLIGNSLSFRGVLPGPTFTNKESFQIADLEPAEGKLLAVATNDDKVYLVDRVGGSLRIDPDSRNDNSTYLSLVNYIDLNDTPRDCLELAFQP